MLDGILRWRTLPERIEGGQVEQRYLARVPAPIRHRMPRSLYAVCLVDGRSAGQEAIGEEAIVQC